MENKQKALEIVGLLNDILKNTSIIWHKTKEMKDNEIDRSIVIIEGNCAAMRQLTQE